MLAINFISKGVIVGREVTNVVWNYQESGLDHGTISDRPYLSSYGLYKKNGEVRVAI